MSGPFPLAHYLEWFMGFIQANLPQRLVPLLVHECDACLSLTELMLLLLWMRMHSSFGVFVSEVIRPQGYCVHGGTLLLSLVRSKLNAPFCMWIIPVLHLCYKEKILLWELQNCVLKCFEMIKHNQYEMLHKTTLNMNKAIGIDTTRRFKQLLWALASACAC